MENSDEIRRVESIRPSHTEKNEYLAEMFLSSRINPSNEFLWRNVPARDLKRRHLKNILADYLETPHKATNLLTTIKKMITAALDEEWIEVDPSYKIKWRPEYTGLKAWPDETMQKFEARWPVGSTPSLTYALAL